MSGDGEKPRASVTAEDLAAQVGKLQRSSTREIDVMAKDKPDELDLAGARKRLSSVSTSIKSILPTAEDIKKEADGEHKETAEKTLQEGRKSLKGGIETKELQRLPTSDCINAERNADLMAGEILTEAKRKLSRANTMEKQRLPTADDIQIEKKAKECVVISSEQMSKAAASKAAAEAKRKSLGMVDNKALAVGGAGQGGGFGLNAPGYGVKCENFTGANKKQVNVSEDIASAWASVMDDEAKTTWVFCKYSADSKEITLSAKGDGGLSEFKAQLGDELAWGGFRCYGVDKRGGTEVRRTKFVFVQVRPEAVGTIKKAKQTSHKADVKEAITGCHLDVTVESVADLDEQGLITKLQAATGAHKPNGYEFEVGKFIEADFYGLGIGTDCKGESKKN